MKIHDAQNKKVLILDEEVDFCELMQFYLEKKNCTVRMSHNFPDAIEMIENDPPDIIIIDRSFNKLIELIRSKVPQADIIQIPVTDEKEVPQISISWNLCLFIVCILIVGLFAFRFFSGN